MYLEFDCYEIPCIKFKLDEEGVSKLVESIDSDKVILITSPQSAQVLLDVLNNQTKSYLKIASVGSGTSKILMKNGIIPFYEPPEFLGATLANTISIPKGSTILYPTSKISEGNLQSILEQRGFVVNRINTYDTCPMIWDEEQQRLAKSMDIVTIASPSALSVWTRYCGTDQTMVAIGPTSARAARELGFSEVFEPISSQGLEGWAKLIQKVAQLKDQKNH